MKNDVDTFHYTAEFIPVPHITQYKAGVFMLEKPLFEEKKFAFIVVNSEQLGNPVTAFQELPAKLHANRATATGHENTHVV